MEMSAIGIQEEGYDAKKYQQEGEHISTDTIFTSLQYLQVEYYMVCHHLFQYSVRLHSMMGVFGAGEEGEDGHIPLISKGEVREELTTNNHMVRRVIDGIIDKLMKKFGFSDKGVFIYCCEDMYSRDDRIRKILDEIKRDYESAIEAKMPLGEYLGITKEFDMDSVIGILREVDRMVVQRLLEEFEVLLGEGEVLGLDNPKVMEVIQRHMPEDITELVLAKRGLGGVVQNPVVSFLHAIQTHNRDGGEVFSERQAEATDVGKKLMDMLCGFSLSLDALTKLKQEALII